MAKALKNEATEPLVSQEPRPCRFPFLILGLKARFSAGTTSRCGVKSTLCLTFPAGRKRRRRLLLPGSTLILRAEMPSFLASSARKSATLASPVSSSSSGKSKGFTLGISTSSQSRRWTGERRGIRPRLQRTNKTASPKDVISKVFSSTGDSDLPLG